MSEPARIDRLTPSPTATGLSDRDLERAYAVPQAPWVRVNFVTSLDGSASREGLSGGLSDAADRRVFNLLRRLCDAVLVGSGTIRAEGYGGMRVDGAAAAWRAAHDLDPQPRLVIVSTRLHLETDAPVFLQAVRRPLVLTCRRGSDTRRRELEQVADVVVCGEEHVDLRAGVAELVRRGMPRILCEGGPSLFAALAAADSVDELCLTLSGILVGGTGPRILHGETPLGARMHLAHVLAAGDTLLTRWTRERS